MTICEIFWIYNAGSSSNVDIDQICHVLNLQTIFPYNFNSTKNNYCKAFMVYYVFTQSITKHFLLQSLRK